jgi:hypothetical protein
MARDDSYAPPRAECIPSFLEADTKLVSCRMAHLRAESDVRAAGTLAYILSALWLLLLFTVVRELVHAKTPRLEWDVSVIPPLGCGWMAFTFVYLGWKLHALRPAGRWLVSGLLFLCVALPAPFGTDLGFLLAPFVAWVFWRPKARMIFRPEYREVVVPATRGMKLPVSMLYWIAAGMTGLSVIVSV